MSQKLVNGKLLCDYPVQLNQVGPDAKLRSCVMFDYLQDAAGAHAEKLNVGLYQLREHRLAWVLSRIKIRMTGFPFYGNVVRVTTYPSGFDRIFAWRQFHISNVETGEVYGTASSAWLTLDPDTGRPVSPKKSIPEAEKWTIDGDVYFPELEKLRIPQDTALEMPLTHRVSATEIDFNNHLNNAYYGIFTEDWLGEKSGSLVRMKEIQVNYNCSMGFRENVICSGTVYGDNQFYVEGVSGTSGKNAFQAEGIFETENK